MINILITGNGGREHALAWKISQSPLVKKIFVAPGNAGTELEEKVTNIDISYSDNMKHLISFIKSHNISLVIVGSEILLEYGIADILKKNNILCFGPNKVASMLETSKIFSKNFMKKYHIPTSKYKIFYDFIDAKNYIEKKNIIFPIVIKADGLAFGKGVLIAKNKKQSIHFIENTMLKKSFNNKNNAIIIEDYIQGKEISYTILVSKNKYITLETSQDYKTRDENNIGPNTGGLGSISPSNLVNEEINKNIIKKILKPIINGMMKENINYTGILYIGLILSHHNKIQVLEFNTRFGDPETQSLMLRLQSDIVPIILKVAEGSLTGKEKLLFYKNSSLSVVLATKNYPEKYNIGDSIKGIEKISKNIKIFHSGTKRVNKDLLTNGGRVLCLSILDNNNFNETRNFIYKNITYIKWNNMFFRKDIGK